LGLFTVCFLLFRLLETQFAPLDAKKLDSFVGVGGVNLPQRSIHTLSAICVLWSVCDDRAAERSADLTSRTTREATEKHHRRRNPSLQAPVPLNRSATDCCKSGTESEEFLNSNFHAVWFTKPCHGNVSVYLLPLRCFY